MSDLAVSVHDLLAKIARDRDRGAFTAFFRVLAPRLKGYFLRSGTSVELADELVQEVMLRVWKSAATYDAERGTAQGWVYRIARNVYIDVVGKLRRHEVDANDPALVPDQPVAPDAAALHRQQAGKLRQALASLPSDQASALRSVYFGFKTMQAAADEQGIAVGTLKSRVRLGFRHLRTALRDEGGR
ncbi:MAG: sigma-70 family RNA polymerase sigma factor [Proteobacteria bacterium]|nr:sigma-70 family RNA polymerase sigma factor [Pseudomonadota bacterium]